MKKLLLKEEGELELIEDEIPQLKKGQVLVKVKYAGICGSDIHILQGNHPTAKPPFIMGHEVCGEIVKLNQCTDVDLKIGDDVFIAGAGTIGILIALVAKMSGAVNIVLGECFMQAIFQGLS